MRAKLGDVAARHVEDRALSGRSNPHLVVAADLLGMEDDPDCPEPSTPGTPAEDAPRFEKLPFHSRDSLDRLEASSEVRDLLGDEFVRVFLTVKRYELARFDDHATDWEREEYAELCWASLRPRAPGARARRRALPPSAAGGRRPW